MLLLAIIAVLTVLFAFSRCFFKRKLPVLVICSSNELKMKMYRELIPKDLIDSAEFVKFSADEIPEIQGSSRKVVLAKLRAYFRRVGRKFPKGSVFLIDDTILEVHEHNADVAGFPGAGTTTLFTQTDDPSGCTRFKGLLHTLPTFGGVWYTCSIGLIRTDVKEEYHEGVVKGSFVPLTTEDKRNIDPQFLRDGQEKTLGNGDTGHPRRIAVENVMQNSKLIRSLLMARDC
jgi:inosine/xanthosine triphosphate pyrophosphatase family protein